MTAPATTTCSRCGAAAAGNYCSNCGAPLAGATCSSCDAPLTPGANFCHRCGTATVRGAPDISTMTPDEQAARLHDRIMALAERGQTDSVQFFAPMALAAYQRLESLNADQRYDLGSIAQLAGEQGIARAQADTILALNPNHLLGLMLAIRAARAVGDTPRAQALERRFKAVAPTERRHPLI